MSVASEQQNAGRVVNQPTRFAAPDVVKYAGIEKDRLLID
jgi:hypothetical protein